MVPVCYETEIELNEFSQTPSGRGCVRLCDGVMLWYDCDIDSLTWYSILRCVL